MDTTMRWRHRLVWGSLSIALACAPATPPVAPEPTPVTVTELYERGVQLRGEGRRREAVEVWEQGLRAQPDHVDTQVALAGTLITLHDFDRARQLLDDAQAASPSDARIRMERGRLHLNLHEYEDALASFGRAMRLDPALRSAQIGRMEALVGLGRCGEARAELEALRRRQRPWRSPRAERVVRSCREPDVE